MTIDYTYDPLNRLTAADYSTGDYYHYTYDAVGNRLTEENQLAVNSYQYDDANRLASMNGVNYTFDDNGNLLSDGVNTYVYDSANRLVSVSGQSAVTSYQYNGLGDRLTQNGTQYVLDLNAGLTQVLSDGENSYVYGLGRISQINSQTEYFLGDALGSMRQLSMTDGEISLAQSYDPYGTVTFTAGTSFTPYGFTGETTDANGLIYLRARYYNPADARFMSRDTWAGDVNNPLSLNRWMYVEGNPVNLVDPSGNIAEGIEAKKADIIRDKLKLNYGVEIRKDWGYVLYYAPRSVVVTCKWNKGNWRSLDELSYVYKSVKNTADTMGGPAKFRRAMKNRPVYVTRYNITSDNLTYYALPLADIVLTNYRFKNEKYVTYTFSHELGHIWDIRSGFALSRNMAETIGTYYCAGLDQGGLWGQNGQGCFYDIAAGKEPPPGKRDLSENYAGTNAKEDWAEAFGSYVYPHYWKNTQTTVALGPLRKQYVHDKISSIP